MKDIISDQRRNERLQQRFAKRLERKMDELESVLRKWVELVSTIPAFRQFNSDSPVIWYYRKNDHHAIVVSDQVCVVARPDHEYMNVLATGGESCQELPMVTALMVNATIIHGTSGVPDLNGEMAHAMPIMTALRQVLLGEGFALYEPSSIEAEGEGSEPVAESEIAEAQA